MYYLMDLERTVGTGVAHYWKSNRHGYTWDIKEAGQFDEPVAARLLDQDFDKRTIMISTVVVERIVKDNKIPTLEELCEKINPDNRHEEIDFGIMGEEKI